jgi:hypothetical protein
LLRPGLGLRLEPASIIDDLAAPFNCPYGQAFPRHANRDLILNEAIGVCTACVFLPAFFLSGTAVVKEKPRTTPGLKFAGGNQ